MVDIGRLRESLSRSRAPIDACFLDGSPIGPTLGTIHASKGREAEDVYLLVPKVITDGDPEEESRVLYVAATRARSRLYAMEAIAAYGDSLDRSGRCFKYEGVKGDTRWNRVKLEVGLDGDLHEEMTVSSRLSTTASQASIVQQALWERRAGVNRLHAERAARGTEYRLTLSDSSQLVGALSRRVFDDARHAAGSQASAQISRNLDHVFMVAARTCVVLPDNRDIAHVHEPYATNGFFLAPVIRGYCATYLNYPRRSA